MQYMVYVRLRDRAGTITYPKAIYANSPQAAEEEAVEKVKRMEVYYGDFWKDAFREAHTEFLSYTSMPKKQKICNDWHDYGY